ncbi:PaaI family thioesterase [Comamonas piscis]|uniref:PaaI family thioesterase n=1 Tax=Comamonas piscis TaxID=1562974 RepID=A0A7G5EK34_9BURK|nr:PaaI family thioesterase [Comamonas piscis]QMV74359.1 PaaI family thioesterase [Comamonas piscis]WSO32806.1 PaaI family thioesterase [Comamonas piscis]
MNESINDPSLAMSGWKQRDLPGFVGTIGPLWTKKVGTAWRYGVLTSARHANPAGIVHGGFLMSLMDHALSAIAWEHCERKTCVTVQMDCQFVAAVHPGAFVEARGHVVRATASLAFVQGAIFVGDESVLTGSAVMKILVPKD